MDLRGWNVKIKFLRVKTAKTYFSHSSHIGPFSRVPSYSERLWGYLNGGCRAEAARARNSCAATSSLRC